MGFDHGTEFVDHPEPERQRHLLRLWLRRAVAAARWCRTSGGMSYWSGA
ncbi:hypothetical protein ACIBJE_22765 [Micromonospora sp. NPDC050187]